MKDRQYTTKELFRRFQPYFKPYWKTLVLDLFCAGLTTLCELVLPMIMRYITNQGLYHLAELLDFNSSLTSFSKFSATIGRS